MQRDLVTGVAVVEDPDEHLLEGPDEAGLPHCEYMSEGRIEASAGMLRDTVIGVAECDNRTEDGILTIECGMQ